MLDGDVMIVKKGLSRRWRVREVLMGCICKYIICKIKPWEWVSACDAKTDEERLIYWVSLHSPGYDSDNRSVWHEIQNWYKQDLDQYVTYFYMGYHLSDLQSSKLIYQPIFILFSYLNSARRNIVIGWCRALICFWFLRLFSKLAHSFIAINFPIFQ